MSDDAAIKAKVEVLAKVFTGRLHVRYQKMNEAFALGQADSGADPGWVELHRLLHSLAGAAGSFGCDALGEQARRIELQVKALLDQPGPDRHRHDIDQIGLALAELQNAT
jgi:HPt (histidine-containing phosphotransfer) domain-containing protein